MSRIARRTILGAALAAPFIAREGFAQGDWPKGPVRWVVAFAAGGAADTVARNIGVRVAEIIGEDMASDLCSINPELVALGKDVAGGIRVRQKRGWGRFFTSKKVG